MSRRRLLVGTALAVTCLGVSTRAQSPAGSPEGFRVLRTSPGAAALYGASQPRTPVWAYDGGTPGPLLRGRQGEELRVRLVNGLPEPTAVHWHGLRLPNAMDGVPHLTQEPVGPGASFDYRFRLPDAGTYWYRPAGNAVEQIGRGLRGALIVDETVPIAVDRDVVMIFEDWRLTPDGRNKSSRHLTVNGGPVLELPARTNERLRLRLVNATVTRALALRFDRHTLLVVAVDGQPAEPFFVRDGRIALGPGNRIDVFVDMTLGTGERASILIEEAGVERPAAVVAYAGAPMRGAPLADPGPLPPNPLPERLDLRTALRHDLPLDVLAPYATPLHERPPLFMVGRGRTVVLALISRADLARAVHVHGHHFRLLDRLDDGWKPYWLDTLTIGGGQTDRVAFRADNPGKWLIESQALIAPFAAAAAWFAVT
jgi:FtsP/CotA-like multicopper oxidase with cupredoxin domain